MVYNNDNIISQQISTVVEKNGSFIITLQLGLILKTGINGHVIFERLV